MSETKALEPEFVFPDNVPLFYANAVQAQVTKRDVTLNFARNMQAPGEKNKVQHLILASIVMTPGFAEAMLDTLKTAIQMHKSKTEVAQ